MTTTHKVIIGDSRNMKEVADESVQLVMTSPPYPMQIMWDKMFNDSGCLSYDQMHLYLSKTWEECYRVLAPGCVACINIGDVTRTINGNYSNYPNGATVTEICRKMGFTVLPPIIWKKNTKYFFTGWFGSMPPNMYVPLAIEYVLFFRKGGNRKFKPKDERRTRLTKEELTTMRQVWDDIHMSASSQKNKFGIFTASYPLEVPSRVIRYYSVPGDTVLDPFLGAGTTSLAALKMDRNSIGYEINNELKLLLQERLSTLNSSVEFIEQSLK